MKVKIAIIYFSGYGHTQKLAEAVAQGVESVNETELKIYKIEADGNIPETWIEELAQVDAMIYGSPTYMGSVAWQFKKFADTSGAAWGSQAWKNKIAGGFTISGSTNGDKHSTMSYLSTLAFQHGQIWVSTGIMPSNKKEHGPDDINWTAGYAGLLAIAPADASPEEAPRKGDLETAKLYGARIAKAAKAFNMENL